MKKHEMNDLRGGFEGGDRRGIVGRLGLEEESIAVLSG